MERSHTAWISFEVDVEGYTASLSSASCCACRNIVGVKCVMSHIAKAVSDQFWSRCKVFVTCRTYALLEACMLTNACVYPLGAAAEADATEGK